MTSVETPACGRGSTQMWKPSTQTAPTCRPHSVSFLGKETDTATPLRLENFGRIDFSLGRWITRGKKTPKSMTPYAKVPGELVRIFFHSLLWPQRSLLYGFPPHCTKQSVFLTLQLDRICKKSSSIFVSNALFQVLRCLDWYSAWKSLLLCPL